MLVGSYAPKPVRGRHTYAIGLIVEAESTPFHWL